MLTRKYSHVRIDRKLTIGENASIVTTSQAGAETVLDVTELATLNVTPGTVTASKAVVVDANKDASAFRNVGVTNIDAGASGTAGSVDVFPATAAKGKLAITCADQTGDTTVSVVAGAMGAARTIALRDPGADASLLTTTDTTAAATTATAAQITRVAAGALHATATFDPASLADGAGETSAAITVTGAAFGDFVLVSAPYDLVGITVTGYVSAANAVKIRVQNESGATVDLASGTWAVRVLKLNS